LACINNPQPESRRETLRSAALALFAERGFAQVGMRELAQHLGMVAGSLYHHFESKEQLLFESVEELYEDLLATTGPFARGTAYERLINALSAHIALHERSPAQFRLAEQELRCLTPPHRQRIQQLRSAYEERLLQLLLEAGASAARAVLRLGVQSLIAWLNNLPSPCTVLSAAQRQEALVALVFAALDNLLGAATPRGQERGWRALSTA
jgi:AcrR family transcriptional regulator